ncbi:MAG: Rad52/Rad22 family DNA repair protein [Ignavibacteriales bacterium]
MNDMFDKLAEPFPPDAISWRVGSTNGDKTKGLALAYLDARDVMDRLDLVCGPAGWQCRYSHANGKTVCDIGIKVGDEWIWKADGAGDTDVEAEKGALSDAFKRAAVRWGIGRYLYGLPSPWVELVPAGRSFKIKDSEYAKLRHLLSSYTGVKPKSSAQAKRDQDFEFFKAKIEAAQDMEELGAVGREIKANLPSLPVAMRDPLHDLYAERREELMVKEPA